MDERLRLSVGPPHEKSWLYDGMIAVAESPCQGKRTSGRKGGPLGDIVVKIDLHGWDIGQVIRHVATQLVTRPDSIQMSL
jgi:hypothetical protein